MEDAIFARMTQDVQNTNQLALEVGELRWNRRSSLLSKIYGDAGNIALSYVKASPVTIRFEVRSRHMNRRMYECFIKYGDQYVDIRAILGYYCECANGLRTVGCCSHVASMVYYLSQARYLSQIIRPAQILGLIFEHEGLERVIADDSA
ncbi:hypothetical protein QAD02_020908 [Eretmocerus hayati]|uniref:Uncharacterized protein n=1 Tax=Eretmocerus hayati TaxID=131215 RepID=A0ACC2PNY4_9HYME|nr:hypothetical protein QAD02_020908 [Eretmocerus hayati]